MAEKFTIPASATPANPPANPPSEPAPPTRSSRLNPRKREDALTRRDITEEELKEIRPGYVMGSLLAFRKIRKSESHPVTRRIHLTFDEGRELDARRLLNNPNGGIRKRKPRGTPVASTEKRMENMAFVQGQIAELDAFKDAKGRLDRERFMWHPLMFSGATKIGYK
ncbi:hypothetical protein M7I_3625 [Glarea lozoyensis 74030]|uniref:Uncharacterized protein n=1 Tax=Glarea lozoyensis (strain ATCC 74030 / MF5533) TaxID=1104152 RepID=H0ELZ9_GLAL7|nr:hypothetical protein M7I_3625 [Glarea lozoyensis 74030]